MNDREKLRQRFNCAFAHLEAGCHRRRASDRPFVGASAGQGTSTP